MRKIYKRNQKEMLLDMIERKGNNNDALLLFTLTGVDIGAYCCIMYDKKFNGV